MVMRAGEIGVAAFDAVDKAVFHQEIERAIYRDRRRPRHRLGEFVDHFIGAERTVAGQQSLQDMTADRREFLRPLLADPFGVMNRVRGAAVMIMVGRGKCGFGRGQCPLCSILSNNPKPRRPDSDLFRSEPCAASRSALRLQIHEQAYYITSLWRRF